MNDVENLKHAPPEILLEKLSETEFELHCWQADYERLLSNYRALQAELGALRAVARTHEEQASLINATLAAWNSNADYLLGAQLFRDLRPDVRVYSSVDGAVETQTG